MTKTKWLIAVLVGLIAAAAIYFVLPKDETPQPSRPADSNQTDTPRSISINQVATHNQANDCWTVINGKVYDLTDYISRHPGGNTILATCGTDGTSLFDQRQTEDGQAVGSGSPHSSRAKQMLESYYLGDLTE